MSKDFDQSVGVCGLERMRLRVPSYGFDIPNQSGVYLDIREGWNDGCRMHTNTLSLDELRALHDLIGRALA